MSKRLTVKAVTENISEMVIFTEKALEKYRLQKKETVQTLLLTEECAVNLINHADDGADITVNIKRSQSDVVVSMTAKGAPIEDKAQNGEMMDIISEAEDDSEEEIRSIILRAFSDKIKYLRRGQSNTVTIKAGVRERTFAIRTLMAFLLSLVISLLFRLILPAGAVESICTYVLAPIQTLFLNALQLVSAPAIFFSIMTAVSKFSAMSDPGRITVKVLRGYIVSSIFAVAIGMLLFEIAAPLAGRADILRQFIDVKGSAVDENFVMGIINNMIPGNVVEPFYQNNGVQLLVIAVIGGIALGRAGKYSAMLREMSDALDRFFSGTVDIVSEFIPIAAFFCTILMVFRFGPAALIVTAVIAGATVIGLLILFFSYVIYIRTGGGLSPIVFLKKYLPEMAVTFRKGSGIGAVADTMKCCDKKFGISPKVYTFSVPIGAMSNMDGNCIYLTFAGLFLTRLCGVEIFGKEIAIMAFMVIVLSIGSPITPGSVLLALTMLMNQMGIPIAILCIILGINAILELALAMFNTAGDVATSIVVAKREGLLDAEVYYDSEKKVRA